MHPITQRHERALRVGREPTAAAGIGTGLEFRAEVSREPALVRGIVSEVQVVNVLIPRSLWVTLHTGERERGGEGERERRVREEKGRRKGGKE